jgi:hypothetical protein
MLSCSDADDEDRQAADTLAVEDDKFVLASLLR